VVLVTRAIIVIPAVAGALGAPAAAGAADFS